MKTVLGIDNGTQSTKVVAYDYENRVIAAIGQSPHELISRTDGTREQEAQWWLTALRNCLSQISPEIKKTVRAIGVSGQQHGFVPLDGEGNVLIPVKLWCDTSTNGECTILTENYGGEEELLKGPGNLIPPGYTASKILWFKRNHPKLYAKMAHILLPHDYINWWLTGEFAMEYGDASGTGLLNIAKRKWDEKLLHLLDPDRDLRTCLPPLIEAEKPCGILQADRAAEMGLPPGIPVSSGGGDNMMGAIGTGAVKEGIITASLGTSGTLYGYSDSPVIDPKARLASFCSSTGGWLPLLCTMNCTVSTELSRNCLDLSLEELEKEALKAPAGSEGIVTLPFYNGERVPNFPHGKGCIMGLDNLNYTVPNICRSAMEASIFGLKTGLDSFRELGFEPGEIRLIGGGANSELWCQMTADILECIVRLPTEKEAAALGAALQALWMLGTSLPGDNSSPDLETLTKEHITLDEDRIYEPDSHNIPVYRDTYNVYQSYVEALSGLFS
ncbi:MAG: xylulokinase [Spirochaetales bacterium]|nr:xylulokinase [Spirochaetales bacterium]